ncbi:MAG: hypothetical protein IJJ26_09520 [Victivallales bacterium]|nr:hypothetical protein [Victivallales bacterium]
MKMKTTDVGIYKHCAELKSGDFRIAITLDFGPRVIGAFIGDSKNLFVELPNEPMPGLDNDYRQYGGHRLWHSPEATPRSYLPDNEPPKVSQLKDGLLFESKTEPESGIQKSIEITRGPKGSFVVTHILVNNGLWPVQLAPWALTQMAPGGTIIIPQGRDLSRNPLAADRYLSLWPYSDLADKRFFFDNDYLFLAQDKKATTAFKLGTACLDGWIAYYNQGTLFAKYIEPWDAETTYADNGCNVETYSCATFIEAETLGALVTLQPGEATSHVEVWRAWNGLPPCKKPTDFRKIAIPIIEKAL